MPACLVGQDAPLERRCRSQLVVLQYILHRINSPARGGPHLSRSSMTSIEYLTKPEQWPQVFVRVPIDEGSVAP